MTPPDRAPVAQPMRPPVTFAGHERVEEPVLTDGAAPSCDGVWAAADAAVGRTRGRVAVSDEVH